MLPQSSRLDDDAGIAGLREGVNGGDWSSEITYIQPALEVARQRRVDEVDDQRLALLADVDAGGVVGQIDDDASLAVLTAPEIDVAQRVGDFTGARLRKARHRRRRYRSDGQARLLRQRDDHRVAVNLRVERLGFVQVEHDARAVSSLNHVE